MIFSFISEFFGLIGSVVAFIALCEVIDTIVHHG